MTKVISAIHFCSDDDATIHAVEDFLNGQEQDFFRSGIEALNFCWQRCRDTEEHDVEK